jgi:chlorite dismutase
MIIETRLRAPDNSKNFQNGCNVRVVAKTRKDADTVLWLFADRSALKWHLQLFHSWIWNIHSSTLSGVLLINLHPETLMIFHSQSMLTHNMGNEYIKEGSYEA